MLKHMFSILAKALSCYQCNSTSEPDCAINDNLPDRVSSSMIRFLLKYNNQIMFNIIAS